MNVYVASSYANASFVRDAIHPKLVELGISPMSQWAERATGAEDFAAMTFESLRRTAQDNDRDLRASDICFVYDPTHSGKETYCEARTAIEWGKGVIWLGKPMLSMFRAGVVRVDILDDALGVLTRMKARHAEGHRGQLLVLGAA